MLGQLKESATVASHTWEGSLAAADPSHWAGSLRQCRLLVLSPLWSVYRSRTVSCAPLKEAIRSLISWSWDMQFATDFCLSSFSTRCCRIERSTPRLYQDAPFGQFWWKSAGRWGSEGCMSSLSCWGCTHPPDGWGLLCATTLEAFASKPLRFLPRWQQGRWAHWLLSCPAWCCEDRHGHVQGRQGRVGAVSCRRSKGLGEWSHPCNCVHWMVLN